MARAEISGTPSGKVLKLVAGLAMVLVLSPLILFYLLFVAAFCRAGRI